MVQFARERKESLLVLGGRGSGPRPQSPTLIIKGPRFQMRLTEPLPTHSVKPMESGPRIIIMVDKSWTIHPSHELSMEWNGMDANCQANASAANLRLQVATPSP